MDGMKKVVMAGALILVWAALAVSQWSVLEEPARVPLTNVTGLSTGVRQSDGRGGGGLHVNVSLLKATVMQRDAAYMTPRNIFSMTSVEGAVPVESNVVVAGQEETRTTEALEEQGSLAESGQFRYLGFLRMKEGPRSSNSVAVIRKNDDVLILQAGDRVDDHLVLKKITPDSVTLRNSDTQVEETVVLSDEVESQE